MTPFAKIIESEVPMVFACAGGGSRFLSDLHALPGSSKVVLGGHDLYSPPALDGYVGFPVVQAVSLDTAFHMAQRAFEEALTFSSKKEVLGVACTAAMATNRERRGEDHAWIVVFSVGKVNTHHHYFKTKGREAQEQELSEVLAELLTRSSVLPGSNALLSMFPALSMVLAGSGWAYRPPVGPWDVCDRVEGLKAVLCGSFNPLHGAHLYMAQIAENLLGGPVGFELSISNVDKGTLEPQEVMRRVEQLRGKHVVLTHAPTFLEKCQIFRNVHFIVGGDTLTRILDPKYGSVEETLQTMRESGNKFLVFSRPGREIPEETISTWGDLFRVVQWGEVDLSSTNLRNNQKAQVRVLALPEDDPDRFWTLDGFIPTEPVQKGETPKDAANRALGRLGVLPKARMELVHTLTQGGGGPLTYIFRVEAEAPVGCSQELELSATEHLHPRGAKSRKDFFGWAFWFHKITR
jgi:nicotinic acid mononucleotide adenylyltransferase